MRRCCCCCCYYTHTHTGPCDMHKYLPIYLHTLCSCVCVCPLANELRAQCSSSSRSSCKFITHVSRWPTICKNKRDQSIDDHYRSVDDDDDDDGYAMTMASEICGNNTSEVHKMRNNQNAKHYEGQSMRFNAMRYAMHINAQ